MIDRTHAPCFRAANLAFSIDVPTFVAMFLDARLSDRFWNKTTPEPNSGCWLWMGSTDAGGYGQIRIDRRLHTAHIISYVTLVGEYNRALDLDHKCRTRLCVNPAHLEPVTRQVNLLRGDLKTAITHCPKGHAYDEKNTIHYRGERRCRECKNLNGKARWKRLADASNVPRRTR